MATQPEAAPGAEEINAPPPTGTPEDQLPPNDTPPADDDSGGDPQPGPYDELARELGWVPKDQYSGDPAQWRDAETFIRTGRDIQRDTARELKALRQTVDTLGKTTAAVIESEVEKRLADLSRQHAEAVEDGDAQRAFDISQQIVSTKSQAPGRAAGPPPEAQDFAERNKAWFKPSPDAPGDVSATARAIEVTERLARLGYPPATQLEEAEKTVKREFPHLFNGVAPRPAGKPPTGVHNPASRAPRQNSGPKGFADMEPESQRVANDMAARISPNDPDGFKKRFAENYWRQKEGKA